MTGPRSSIYGTRGRIEDILALLGSVQERQRVILLHAYQETGYGPIFEEAADMAGEIMRVRRIVQAHWCEVQAVIDAANEG